jgi:hypothetical protein
MIVGGLCIQGRGRTALPERWARTLVDIRGLEASGPLQITTRLHRAAHGIASITAYCHDQHSEKTFRLDRLLECGLE